MKFAPMSIASDPIAWRRVLLGLGAVAGLAVLSGLGTSGMLREPKWHLLASAPAVVRLHVAAAVTALIVGSVLLVGPKGRSLHKSLGWIWVVAMATVAISSLFIHSPHTGRYSLIHLLSGWTIISLPMGIAAIRRRKVALHRRTMTGLFVGGIIIAGAFTFLPGRLMWHVFVG